VKQHLEQKFPGIIVEGSNYPPAQKSMALAQIVQMGMMATLGVTLMGPQIFGMLKMDPPTWHTAMAENKMTACMTTWFLGNTVAQNLISTGAFEVYYDGQLVFSKLKTGRLPQVPSILEGVGDLVGKSGNLPGARKERIAAKKAPGAGKKVNAEASMEEELDDDIF